MFRVDEQQPIADGDLIVITQIREAGAGSRVSVR
jgi:hypothetical protein